MAGRAVRVARRALIAFGVVIACGVAGAWLVLTSAVPDRDIDRLEAPGLRETVRVAFDDQGRPWVDAGDYGDALFALGWLQARDRRWQMELLRRAGFARLAELLGADLFETDAAMVRAGVPALAAALEANADAETLGWVDRFVAGVALADAEGAGSPEFLLLGASPAPFTRSDVFAIGALMAFDSANNMDNELLRLALTDALGERAELFLQGDRIAIDQPWVVGERASAPGAIEALAKIVDALAHPQRLHLQTGSSAWAVAPRRAANDRAILAFDSHDAWSMPSLLYEAHLFWRDVAGEARQLRGFSVAGLPGVINGFTDGGAWGLTNIGDSQDLVLETIRDDQVLAGEDWVDLRREQVMVPVRGEAARFVDVLHTPHGPLVSMDPPLALMWSGHAHDEVSLAGLFALNRARTWTEASAAVDRLFAPSANLTWADRDGHIASRVHGRLPERMRGSGLHPLDASEGSIAWRGFLPMAALPRTVDPEIGWVSAANAKTSASGPLVSADNAPGYRARRIRSHLESRPRHSVDDFRAMQVDMFDEQAARLLPVLLGALEAKDAAPEPVLDLLLTFAANPLQRRGSGGALLYAYWYQALLEVLFADALGPDLFARLQRTRYPVNHAVDRLMLDDADSDWWRGDRDARLRESLARALERVHAAHGTDVERWRWDAVHGVKFPHQLGAVDPRLDAWLSRGPFPWGGGNATLGRARYRYDRPFEARGGASMRMVVELSAPPRAFVVMPGGQSGHVFDAHYDDQFDTFLGGRLYPLASSWQPRARMITLVPTDG